jgi:hypothetical protein
MTFRLMEPARNSEIRRIILRGESGEMSHIRELDATNSVVTPFPLASPPQTYTQVSRHSLDMRVQAVQDSFNVGCLSLSGGLACVIQTEVQLKVIFRHLISKFTDRN